MKSIQTLFLALIIMSPLFVSTVKADTSISYQFINPLGGPESWSFEGDDMHHSGLLEYWPPIENATGHYEFDWAFATSSSSQFQIRVTAKADFGYVWFEPNTGIPYLYYANTTSASTVVTIYA